MKRAFSPLLVSVATAIAGAVLLGVGFLVDPRQAFFSYLAAWVFAASLAVGALLWVQIAHATHAGWMVVLRRRAEDVVGALPVLAVLFVPVLLGVRTLYPWARPEGEWSHAEREAIVPKHAWLNEPFFACRAVFYLATWVIVGEILRRLSRAQDTSPSPAVVSRLRAVSAASIPLVAFTLTFAAFDSLMSLDPTWSSNTFGVYLFGGGFGGAVGLLCFVCFGPLPSRLAAATPEHSHALGRILLTFVIFWAYIAFTQYLIIWIADLPHEVGWVQLRMTGSWGLYAIALVTLHFVLPFLILLSRALKRRPRALAWMGAWICVAHYVDVYWLVLPPLHARFHPHWLDLAALLTVCGTATSVVALRCRREPELAENDPGLAPGLRYEAT
jgi:hypothetical protein